MRALLAWCGLTAGAVAQTESAGGSSRGSRPGPPVLIFFPPHPPPLDRPVPAGVPERTRAAAPAELAAFINEPFYPQLGTRLASRSLSAPQRAAVEAYRSAKQAALAQLRAEWQRRRDLEPLQRRQALEDFARRQRPQLAEFEATAETLRQKLSASGADWSDRREWHLTDRDRRGFSPVELAYVIRAYAYYQAGLLPAQRRLLREIALELLMAADSAEKAAANQPHVFFQPELARVALPAEVSNELAARIAAYQTRKSRLKKELFDAVREHDGAAFGFLRNPFRRLADAHARELSELETLAERIRVELAQRGPPSPPEPRSPLPLALAQRLKRLLQDREAAERHARERVEAITIRAGRARVEVRYRLDSDGMKFVVLPPRRNGALSPEEMESTLAIREAMSEIADEFGTRMAELINERDEVRRSAGALLGTQEVSRVDAGLAAAHRSILQQQNAAAYAEYRLAVFEPGLSPEQRRLLFDAAIEQLNLPLPHGELQPARRAATW